MFVLSIVSVLLHTIYSATTETDLQNQSQQHVTATTSPSFASTIPNVTVPQGKEAVLPCTVKNLGKFKVGWIHADTQTILTLHGKVITHNQRIHVSHEGEHIWRLHVKQARESDRGCYMCQINTAEMKKQLGCIDVHVPPDIISEETSRDTTVSEGSDVTLTCRARGHPTPSIVWRREDGNTILGQGLKGRADQVIGTSLSLKKITRHQMGAYLCIAKNTVPPAVSKRILLSVNFKPLVKVVSQLMGAPYNTDVSFECYVEAHPPAFNYWLKNDQEMLLDGKKYKIEEKKSSYKVEMKLTINSFAAHDEAVYTCVSTNSIGKTEGQIRLYKISSSEIQKNGPDALTGSSDWSESISLDEPHALASTMDRTFSILLLLTAASVLL